MTDDVQDGARGDNYFSLWTASGTLQTAQASRDTIKKLIDDGNVKKISPGNYQFIPKCPTCGNLEGFPYRRRSGVTAEIIEGCIDHFHGKIDKWAINHWEVTQ